MKLAMPYDHGRVNQHFGTSREFAIVEVEDGIIKARKTVSADQLQHNHEGLAGLMKSENVDVVITGGIGAMALIALQESGLQVVSGANGNIEDVAVSFIRGELNTQGAACCNHHGEHGHGCHHG